MLRPRPCRVLRAHAAGAGWGTEEEERRGTGGVMDWCVRRDDLNLQGVLVGRRQGTRRAGDNLGRVEHGSVNGQVVFKVDPDGRVGSVSQREAFIGAELHHAEAKRRAGEINKEVGRRAGALQTRAVEGGDNAAIPAEVLKAGRYGHLDFGRVAVNFLDRDVLGRDHNAAQPTGIGIAT